MKRLLSILAGAFMFLVYLVPPVHAHGGDPGLIHACVKKNGDVEIVGPSATCKQNETPLHWNIQGLKGDQGIQGVKGDPGLLASFDHLDGLACTTPAGLAGVIELVYYGPSGVPTLRCRVPGGGRFIDNGDSTVTDTETKLMWEKKEAGGSGFSTCLTNIHGVDSQCTWRQAMGDWLDRLNGRFIFSQNEGGFAGYSDWRLPTVAELRTIVDCSFSSCVI